MNEEPEKPPFWDERYLAGKTPWHMEDVPDALRRFLHRNPPSSVLIPGCGAGQGITAFVDAGWEVTGIDFSRGAIQEARQRIGPKSDLIVHGDFFRYPFEGRRFSVIYERTFLCALSPYLRTDYIRRMWSLLEPEGRLVGAFFYGEEDDPPPYPLGPGEKESLFPPRFHLEREEEISNSLPMFAGRERWQEWRRQAVAE
jgi:SAM-dependent methyltransferase